MIRFLNAFLILCLAAVAAAAAEPALFEIETLGGSPIRGPITRWTAQEVVIATKDGPITLRTDRLLSVRPLAPAPDPTPRAPCEAQLTDGSTIRMTDFVSDGKQATLILPAAQGESSRIALPRRSVSIVLFQELSLDFSKQWQGLLAEEFAGDLLVFRKGDSLDYVEGVIDSVTSDQVLFKTDGDTIRVNRGKVFGLVFHRQPAPAARKDQCVVFARDGSRYTAQAARLEPNALVIRSHAGFERTLLLTQIQRIDFSAGKIAYLSDLPFESVDWTPFFGFPDSANSLRLFGQPRRDESFGSRPLELEGKQYAKGLALRTRTEIVTRLSRKYQQFFTIAGLDSQLGAKGHVVLEIFGDDRSLLKVELHGEDPPQEIKLDVSGVKLLKIVADYGENLDISDFLNLCDAKVVK